MIRELFLSNFSLSSCVWQSTIFLVVGLVGSFILRHRSSRAHQVLFLAMMAAVIVPIMSILVKHYELGLFVAEPVVIQPSAKNWATASDYGPPGVLLAENIEHKPGAIEEILPSAMAGSEIAKLPWRSVVLYGWIAASLILAARLLVTFVLGVRLLGRALPLECQRIKEAAHLAGTKLGIDKDVKVRSSRSVRSPVIWCWRRRPVLLVPSDAGRFDNRVDWAGVLCHELAHWKRRDHISGLLAELVACILPWHLFVWWAKSRLIRLSEQACDDWVVASGQPSTDYAESLLDLTPGGQMAFVPAVVSSKKGLAGRVRRILKDHCGNPRTGTKWALATSLATLCLTFGVALAQTRHAEPANTETQEKPPAKSLHEAVKAGDLAEVQRLIAEGADVNAKNERAMTPLSWGIYTSALTKEIAELLIENGADVDAQDDEGMTPLHGAIYVDIGKDIVSLLISKSTNVNLRTEEGRTPLYYAIMMEDIDIVKLLVDKGADFNVKNEKGWTALHRVALDGRKDMVELFISKGADTSSFHMAAFMGDLSRVKEFIEKGTKVDTKDEAGWTALFWAACAGREKVAEFLIDNNADISANDGSGQSLLHQAAQAHPDAHKLVELLIAKDADLNAKNHRGDTPLHLACYSGNKEVAGLLIGKGADINAKNRGGRTPLHNAALTNRREVAELLVSKGADVNAENNIRFTRYTPLHLAAMADADIVEFLIDKGADINASDRVPGITPLAWAVRQDNPEIVELLITKGADVNVHNTAGVTPLDMAEKRGDTQIVEILQKHGAKKGSSSLLGAVISGDIEQVKSLISKGADVNAKDQNGQSPLQLALNRDRMEVAALLVASGADVNATDGRTGKALLLSVGGRKERVEFLLLKGANIEAKDGNGLTLLQLMAAYSNQKDYLDVVKLLIEKGADIETRGHGDTTPLQTAVAVGRKEVAELLLAHGAKVNVMSKYWGTPAHHAMRDNQPELVRWSIAKGIDIPPLQQAAYYGETDKVRSLLSAGANVNQKDKAEFTPLHCAVFGRKKEVVQLLIKNGADVKAKSCGDATPLFWACERGYLDMVKLLVDNGADVNGRAFRGLRWGTMLMDNWSNLHTAAHMGHVDVVEYLLVKGADINAKCTRGDGDLTPLHFAARKGNVNVVKALLAKGADTNLKSKEGRTALGFAREKNHTNVIDLLRKHGARE